MKLQKWRKRRKMRWKMNKERLKEFANRILDSWIGKTISFVAYHLLWRIFIKKGEEQ